MGRRGAPGPLRRRSSSRSRRRSRSSTSTPCGANARFMLGRGRRASRSASPPSRCARWSRPAADPRARPGLPGDPRLHASRGAVADAGQGFEDLVVAYPTTDREALAELVEVAADDPGRAPVPMVDSPPHLDLIEAAIHGGARRGAGLPRPRPRLVARRRQTGSDRPQALTDQDSRGGAPAWRPRSRNGRAPGSRG